MGFVNNHFIKFHSCVHTAHIAFISEKFWIKWTFWIHWKKIAFALEWSMNQFWKHFMLIASQIFEAVAVKT